MESKIDQLKTIVKSAQKLENLKNNKGKSPKQTPKKSDWPTMSAAGPFRKGKSHYNVGAVVVGDILVVNVQCRET